jgi:hypothetical protein
MKTMIAALLAAALGATALFAYAAPVSIGPDIQSADEDKDKDKDKDKKPD